MPLQNRVDPFGELCAVPARGGLFGNRGGRFHTEEHRLSRRRHVSRAWICCRLAFKGRHRTVWGPGYTELFFLDEPTAFAAGHRPCFECRYHDAKTFAAAWADAAKLVAPPRAAEMDAVLHAERIEGRVKRRHHRALDDLPDGAIVLLPEEPQPLAIRGDSLLTWTHFGYANARPRPRGISVEMLTPPAIAAVLSAGYEPRWHPSAAATVST